jgi:hypothetical protein
VRFSGLTATILKRSKNRFFLIHNHCSGKNLQNLPYCVWRYILLEHKILWGFSENKTPAGTDIPFSGKPNILCPLVKSAWDLAHGYN